MPGRTSENPSAGPRGTTFSLRSILLPRTSDRILISPLPRKTRRSEFRGILAEGFAPRDLSSA